MKTLRYVKSLSKTNVIVDISDGGAILLTIKKYGFSVGSNKSGAPIMDWKPMIQTQAQIDPIMLKILRKLEEDMI